MSDPADLPPAPPEGVTAAPPAPDAETYRPLEWSALLGFVLAAGYALTVGVGAAVCLGLRAPLLLWRWTVLVPVVALVCSLIARGRIRASEGVRSGLALTAWGIGLSAFFGAGYGAYYLATRLAVQKQARDFADAWLEELRRGDLEQAFWRTVPPEGRPADPKARTRAALEIEHNAPPPNNPGATGPLTGFGHADYVRILRQAGDRAKVTFAGMADWEFGGGGYQVALLYDVETPLASFPLRVTLRGVEGRGRAGPGRQWQVLLGGYTGRDLTDYSGPRDPVQMLGMTPEGKEVYQMGLEAHERAQKWAALVIAGQTEEAFRASRPWAEKEALTRAAPRVGALGLALGAADAVGAVGLTEDAPATRDYLRARSAFVEGGLVRADPAVFWADDTQRGDVVEGARALFDPAAGRPGQANPGLPPPFPDCDRDGEAVRIRVTQPLMLLPPALPSDKPRLPFLVEARVLVVRDKAADGAPWRVEALELVRARTLAPPAQGRGPGAE
jgi:hypothetical protein